MVVCVPRPVGPRPGPVSFWGLTGGLASGSLWTVFSIKLLRVVLGIGQREFSQRSGVSIRELARIEAAEVLPRRDAAQKIDLAFEAFILERAAPVAKERAEDRADVAVARERLAEIAEHPERVVTLAKLERRLKAKARA